MYQALGARYGASLKKIKASLFYLFWSIILSGFPSLEYQQTFCFESN